MLRALDDRRLLETAGDFARRHGVPALESLEWASESTPPPPQRSFPSHEAPLWTRATPLPGPRTPMWSRPGRIRCAMAALRRTTRPTSDLESGLVVDHKAVPRCEMSMVVDHKAVLRPRKGLCAGSRRTYGARGGGVSPAAARCRCCRASPPAPWSPPRCPLLPSSTAHSAAALCTRHLVPAHSDRARPRGPRG